MRSTGEHWFIDACKGPFAFLSQRYGFAEPTQNRAGNEFSVHYQKQNKAVVVSIEPFGHPVVALFYPSIELANRRFPRQTILPRKKELSEEEELARSLAHCAEELEANANEFLSDEKNA